MLLNLGRRNHERELRVALPCRIKLRAANKCDCVKVKVYSPLGFGNPQANAVI
jgi:hypothetical protein